MGEPTDTSENLVAAGLRTMGQHPIDVTVNAAVLICAADEIERLASEVADLRTMVDFPEVVAGYAGPSGSTCMKVIGNDEKEYLRRSWKNAITQWQWWHERYAAATGDTRGRTQIECAEIAERRKENRHA